MSGKTISIVALAALLAVASPASACADGFDCDASVIDVAVGTAGKNGDPDAADVYLVPAREMAITAGSVFEVFRPAEVNDESVRHYPLALYVGRLRVIDTQDEILIGRMIEFASGSEYPRLRHKTVMIGDCLRLQVEPLSVEQDMLPAEAPDVSGLVFHGTEAPRPTRIIPSKILFQFDSAVIQDKWEDDLAELADYMARENPDRVIVQGHACRIGTDEYNLKLSERRARAVVDYLVSRYGIDRSIFEVEAFGESRPEVSNETEEGRRKNRRAATLVFFQSVPTTLAAADSSDWPLAVGPEELAPEDAGIPVISSKSPENKELPEDF